MRALLLLPVLLLTLLVAAPTPAQNDEGPEYRIDLDPTLHINDARGDGKLYVTLQLKILRSSDGSVVTNVPHDDIHVEEDGKPVADLEITQPSVEKLTTVVAMDVSGSMQRRSGSGGTKIEEARQAANVFLSKLDSKADTGLILFDHEMKVMERPTTDPLGFKEHRARVHQLIDEAQPAGGTAFIDAAYNAVEMLRDFSGRRAVLLMTDGVDMNSKRTLYEVIKKANVQGVPIYTLGIGEPGKNEPVTTVLVLDHSGSMNGKASDTDEDSKIVALKGAATRFVDLMRHNATTTLLPFSSEVEAPEPFSASKDTLHARIQQLKPQGGTSLYDATYAGIETLQAEQRPGRKAVVVLTDGRDESPGSRCSDRLVIERAREMKVPLYMLGLGRPEEINEAVMKRMAEETGGEYYYAGSQKRLLELFEQLSIRLHDDGIDEAALRELAEKTGGKYFHARDVSKLPDFFVTIAEELESTYTITFPSRRPTHDGTARGIDVSIVRGGKRVSNVGSTDYNVRGVVVAEMDSRIYLLLLAALGVFLLAPAGLRRLQHKQSAT
jgi:VWFA-related protein